jgi:TRAP-type C4-dicarboxylate transport system permease small subunit
LKRLRNITDRLIGLCAFSAGLGLLTVVAVILADVVGRAFGAPVMGARDVSEMTMVIVVFGGMALCDRSGGHIVMDLFERHYPPAVNRWIDIIAALLGAVIFAAIAWTVWESAGISRMLNLSTNLLNLPKAWFQWALAGFAVVTALALALRALELALGRPDVRRDGNTAS